jgi:hypothetical protein
LNIELRERGGERGRRDEYVQLKMIDGWMTEQKKRRTVNKSKFIN